MMMRTDLVDMFYVHYLTALNTGVKNSLLAQPRRAVLLHYKTPSHTARTLVGRTLPLNTTYESIAACNNTQYVPLHRQDSVDIKCTQDSYTQHRDEHQIQLIKDTYCVRNTNVSSSHHTHNTQHIHSMGIAQNIQDKLSTAGIMCGRAAAGEWRGDTLSKINDFTHHYIEPEIWDKLVRNVRNRLVT